MFASPCGAEALLTNTLKLPKAVSANDINCFASESLRTSARKNAARPVVLDAANCVLTAGFIDVGNNNRRSAHREITATGSDGGPLSLHPRPVRSYEQTRVTFASSGWTRVHSLEVIPPPTFDYDCRAALTLAGEMQPITADIN